MSAFYERHGQFGTPEYHAWAHLIQRCVNPRNRAYANYGGRGIRVCPRWRTSFAAFLADMGPKPGPEFTLDRRDNNGDYTPENCRWATVHVQNRNRRDTILYSWRGEQHDLIGWSERLGICVQTLRMRLHRQWPVDDVFAHPVTRSRRQDAIRVAISGRSAAHP